jgi:hypothetical protein
VRRGAPGNSLPATLNVASPAPAPTPSHRYGEPAATLQSAYSQNQGGYSQGGYSQGGYGAQQPAVALPNTLNVVSIIDQPPTQRSSYGISGTAGHDSYTPAAPMHAPPAQQWQTHYVPEGRPYYFNPGTGQTTWDAPT